MRLPESKLPDVGTTIFTVMSQLAHEHDALNLSQGFPDFEPPQALLDRVTHHLNAGHNQYAPMPGVPELRTAIAAKTRACYEFAADPDTEITVTSGATSALFCAIMAMVGHDDEVIVLDPAYDSYDPAIRLAGGKPVHVPLSPPHFGVDWDRVRDAITARTRMIVFNSPHNPTGAVLSSSDLQVLQELVTGTDIVIVSDEVYEHMVYDGQRHESMLRYPELAARSLVVSSFGKTWHATGWKIGYVIAPPSLTAEFRRIHQFVQFCVASPIQYALAEYLTSAPEHFTALPAFYEAKRDRFIARLEQSRFRCVPSAGTYFQLADYRDIGTANDVEFTRWMTAEKGVAAIPVSVFYSPEHVPEGQTLIRFCFAKSEQTIDTAGKLLCKI